MMETIQIKNFLNINFEVGDLIINSDVGLINKITRISEKGYLYAVPIVWKDFFISPNARESCLNPLYFRKVTKKDLVLFQKRGVISGHPEKVIVK